MARGAAGKDDRLNIGGKSTDAAGAVLAVVAVVPLQVAVAAARPEATLPPLPDEDAVLLPVSRPELARVIWSGRGRGQGPAAAGGGLRRIRRLLLRPRKRAFSDAAAGRDKRNSDIASPGGAAPSIDQDSLRDIYWTFDSGGRDFDANLIANLPGWRAPKVLEDLSDDDLNDYQGVFVPGGHAPMVDLYQNPAMGQVLRHFHSRSQPIGLICHAPIVLMATAGSSPWPFSGYKLAVFSKTEEKIAETLFLKGGVPFYPDEVLAAAGASIDDALIPSVPHVVVDRELVTGQNPFSPKPFAAALLTALQAEAAPYELVGLEVFWHADPPARRQGE